MSKRKELSVIVIFIMINNIFFISDIADSSISTRVEDIEINPDDLNILYQNDEDFSNKKSRSNIECSNGGSWLDNFDDDSKIDMLNSENIITRSGSSMLESVETKITPDTSGLWHFDEGTGKNAIDSSDNQNDGNLKNGLEFHWNSSGKHGYALNFDGKDDYIHVDNDPSLNFNERLTIELWVHPKRWGDSEVLVSKWWGYLKNDSYVVYLENHNYPVKRAFRFQIGEYNDFEYVETSGILSTNNWYHIVGVYTGSKLLIYLNGELSASKTTDIYKIANTKTNLGIGANPGGGRNWFYGLMDEIGIYNRAFDADEIKLRYERGSKLFKKSGVLTTDTISIPDKMNWDSIYINKTQPANTFINISILNAHDDKIISGSPTYTESNEFDISYINKFKYPNIKLKATFYTDKNSISPELHGWGVSWNESNAWRDDFFGGLKIDNYSDIDNSNGTIVFKDNGTLESKAITIPARQDYNLISLINYYPLDGYFKTTVINAFTNEIIPGYSEKKDSFIDISGIDPIENPSIKLKLSYNSDGPFGILECWSVNWTTNSPPFIADIISPPFINRTESAIINIKMNDKGPFTDLEISVYYKSPLDTTWKSDYLSIPEFVNGTWICKFSPPKTARLGLFSFNFSCIDSDLTQSFYKNLHQIEVLNKKPERPDISLKPARPSTRVSVSTIVTEPRDTETAAKHLEQWYRWYKNGDIIPEYNNRSELPAVATKRGDRWACEVVVYDGTDMSKPGRAEVTIENSPPTVVTGFRSYEFLEDSTLLLDDKLSEVFRDFDNDNLTYRAEGQEKINVNITRDDGTVELASMLNWQGTELVTFYANDSLSETNITVEFTVIPVNDLPQILKVGDKTINENEEELEFIINEREWLNLSIIVEDVDTKIDSGEVEYSLNISERENLYIDQDNAMLSFHPSNLDIGWHYLTLRVTDGYSTPPIYVSFKINIYVINVNDVPWVEILTPDKFQEFNINDRINFSSQAGDEDLLMPGSSEHLTFHWFLSSPFSEQLGEGNNITITGLPAGTYIAKVVVTDGAGATSEDSVMITVIEDVSGNTNRKQTAGSSAGIIIFAIIIIIIIAVALYAVMRRRRTGISTTEVGDLTKSEAGGSGTLSQPPGSESGTKDPSAEKESRLNALDKLELLEERFLKGDISLDEFKGLKVKYEKEASRTGIHPEALTAMPVDESSAHETAENTSMHEDYLREVEKQYNLTVAGYTKPVDKQ
jgi:hypothetical protein